MKINSPVTDGNAVERFSDMLLDCADMFGRFPAATKKVDIDAWEHLLVYAPIEAIRYIISLKENNNDPD